MCVQVCVQMYVQMCVEMCVQMCVQMCLNTPEPLRKRGQITRLIKQQQQNKEGLRRMTC
jgi:hypothetical protein